MSTLPALNAVARRVSKCAIALLVCGCAGSGDGLDENGLPFGTNGTNTLAQSEFDIIQQSIFTPVCTGCHSGAGAPLGMSLQAGQSYTMLVGVPSEEVPSLQRAQPGNPDASYLVQKLAGTNSVGDRMPQGGPYLSTAAIDLIRQWILNGALPTSNTVMSPASGVDSSSAKGVALSDGMKVLVASATATRVIVGFDREVDATLFNATTVTLRDAAASRLVSLYLTALTENSRVLIVKPQRTLDPGTYVLTLRGTGGGALAGLDARPLNAHAGDPEGADFSMTFTVEAVK